LKEEEKKVQLKLTLEVEIKEAPTEASKELMPKFVD
jgi:hypothetical protein